MLSGKRIEVKSLHNVEGMVVSIMPFNFLFELDPIIAYVHLDDYRQLEAVLKLSLPECGQTKPTLAE